MNKNVRKVCALVLSGIFCFSGGIQGSAKEFILTDSSPRKEALEPYLITTGSAISVYNNSYQIEADEEEKTNIMVPIVVTNSGLVAYDVELLGKVVTSGSIAITVYGDEDRERLLQKKKTYSVKEENNEPMTGSVYLEEGQKCYLRIEVSKKLMVEEEWYRFCIRLQEYNSENCTLPDKTEMYSYQNGKGDAVYYKVYAERDGILTIDTEYDKFSYGAPKVVLCNSKKKAMSAKCNIQIMNAAKVKKKKATPEGKNIFAVTKGTYYVKLSNVQGTYKIKSTFSKVKENSGITKAKAKKLSLNGKTVKGLVLCNDKKTKCDWYKFNLEESKRIRILFKGSTSGKEKLQVEVIPPSSAEFTKRAILSFSGIEGNGSGKSGTQWPEGTYYLKINKTTAKGTGVYRLQVKSY